MCACVRLCATWFSQPWLSYTDPHPFANMPGMPCSLQDVYVALLGDGRHAWWQDMVEGLQKIQRQSEGQSPSNALAELKAAGLMQRKLHLYMLATQDPSQEAAVRPAVLHTAEYNLQQPWQVVLQTHEDILVGCSTAHLLMC